MKRFQILISTDEEYAEIASRILDEWLSESDGS